MPPSREGLAPSSTLGTSATTGAEHVPLADATIAVTRSPPAAARMVAVAIAIAFRASGRCTDRVPCCCVSPNIGTVVGRCRAARPFVTVSRPRARVNISQHGDVKVIKISAALFPLHRENGRRCRRLPCPCRSRLQLHPLGGWLKPPCPGHHGIPSCWRQCRRRCLRGRSDRQRPRVVDEGPAAPHCQQGAWSSCSLITASSSLQASRECSRKVQCRQRRRQL